MGFWDKTHNDKGLTLAIPPIYYNDQLLYNRANTRVLGDGYYVPLYGSRYNHYWYPSESSELLSKLPPFSEWNSTWKTGINFESGYKIDYRFYNNYYTIAINSNGTRTQIERLHTSEINLGIKIYFLCIPVSNITEYASYNSSGTNLLPCKILNAPENKTNAFIRVIRNRAYGGAYYPDVIGVIINTGIHATASEYYFEFDFNNTFWNQSNLYRSVFFGNLEPTFQDDTSKTQGGDGKYKYNTEEIDFPDLPTNNIFSSSLLSAYKLDNTQLALFSNYLWSSDFLENVGKLMSEPMQAVISLSTHNVPSVETAETTLKIATLDTGISASRVLNQWQEIDCGTLTIDEFWGSVMDYSPHTQVDLYLPFVAVQRLSVSDIMRATLHLKYHIDLLSGSCVAYLKVSHDYGLDSILYTFNGNVLSELPLTANNKMQMTKSIIENALSSVGNGAMAIGSAMTGNIPATIMTGTSAISSGVKAGVQSALYNSIDNVQRSGSIGASFGMLNYLTPYLIITRPVQSLADGYANLNGFPCNVKLKLSELTGYTEVDSIHLENIACTDNEKREIENLLKSGVIL